jgi:hypothetical protein
MCLIGRLGDRGKVRTRQARPSAPSLSAGAHVASVRTGGQPSSERLIWRLGQTVGYEDITRVSTLAALELKTGSAVTDIFPLKIVN